MTKSNFICCLLLIACTLTVSAQEKEELKNWHLKPFSKELRGTNVDKAYQELLSKKSPQEKIIVAVIDSGVDIEHEDLSALIWTNTDEIPNNGIDDDKNGYIDDVHGWNFLGNANGDMVTNDNLEVTRLFKKYSDKFQGKTANEIKVAELEEWKEYQRVKNSFEESKIKADNALASYKNFKESFDFVHAFFVQKLGEDFTADQLKAFEPANEQEAEMKGFYTYMLENGVDQKYLDEYKDYVTKQAEWYYNPNVDVRRDIIKDDPNNLHEVGYGNNNVSGVEPTHGTHVAGIIGAIRNNGIGVDGVANSIEIMPIRTVPGGDEHDKDVANSIRYAVDNGARVVNMSFGKAFAEHEALVAEAIQYAEDHDVLLIHAAGNDSENLDKTDNFPSNFSPYIKGKVDTYITVGASSFHPDVEFVADFSNYGQLEVDIFAPGVDIYSTYPNNEYEFNDGTSMAAPVVSGVAALILSYYPDLKGAEVKKIIEQTAHKLPNEEVYLPGSGEVDEEGQQVNKELIEFEKLSQTAGLIDAYAALQLADEKSKY